MTNTNEAQSTYRERASRTTSRGEEAGQPHKARNPQSLRDENTRLDQLNKELSVFAAVVDSTDDAILTQNPEGVIESWNSAAERMFGFTADEALGRDTALLAPRNRRSSIPELIAAACAGRPIRNVETVQRRKDGGLIDVALTVSPVRGPSGEIIGTSTIARDISERKRSQKLLAERARQLSHSHDEMEQLIYIVSHDLKSPLVTIGGFADRLTGYMERGEREKFTNSVDRIRRAISRMTQLIDDLLQVSRIRPGGSPPQQVNAASLVRELYDDIASRFPAIEAELRVADDIPPIHMERSQTQQLFENLLTNAMKYGSKQDRCQIEVGGEKAGEHLHFFVRDHGPGIAPEHQDRIFNLFQRLQNGGEGSGVGLAIVAKIVKLHGGRVWVDSTPGHGATFRIQLPCNPPEYREDP